MDARVVVNAKMPSRRKTDGRARSGRTLAEMSAHRFLHDQNGEIVRLDVAGGVTRTDPSRTQQAERANDRKPRGHWSGATGRHSHTVGSARPAAGHSSAKEKSDNAHI
jgi:CO/xanthine dehydrogenase FAD-binding subunit